MIQTFSNKQDLENNIYLKQSDQNTFKEFFLSHWYFAFIAVHLPEKELGRKVNDLDATEDGEASEESHCASDHTQLGN